MYWKSLFKAGKAIFTVENSRNGERYTFRVRQKRGAYLWFVCVLTGPENSTDYTYIGTIFQNNKFEMTPRSSRNHERAFKWFQALNNIYNSEQDLPDYLKFYPATTCARCGRALTVPASVELGLGPECVLQTAMAGRYGVGHFTLDQAKAIRKLINLQRKLAEEEENENVSVADQYGLQSL